MKAVSNIAASAKASMEKTKAIAQEKIEKMTTRDPLKKQLAEEKKKTKIHEAERTKLKTHVQNKAAKHRGRGQTTGTHGGVLRSGTGTGTTTTGTGHKTGGLASLLPGTGHTKGHHH